MARSSCACWVDIDLLKAHIRTEYVRCSAEPSAAEETAQPADDHPYTDKGVAAYETRWDVYMETGSLATVRKTVKRIDSVGVSQVAFERADHGLSASTLQE